MIPAVLGLITLTAPEAQKVDLAVYQQDGHAQGVLTLTLATDAERPIIADATLAVPHGAKLVGLSLALGDASPSLAKPMSHEIAERAFRSRTSTRKWDPALLSRHSTAKKQDTYDLRVFPLAAGSNARVEIIFELPKGKTFGKAEASVIDGVATSMVSVTSQPGLLFASDTLLAVDTDISLYADDPTLRPASPIIVDLASDPDATTNEIGLRPMLRRRLDQLRACFAHETANLGAFTLHFALLPNGRIGAVSLDGAGAETNQCVGGVLANVSTTTTPFDEPEGDTTLVSYPLMWIRT
ncbi:MAG TPA: hypothetical protein VL326_20755 [Kofleriaceae bacterium]|jgi:hypothetical protein|nr:hypothetical protein [Kofleriaceae bacterium]